MALLSWSYAGLLVSFDIRCELGFSEWIWESTSALFQMFQITVKGCYYLSKQHSLQVMDSCPVIVYMPGGEERVRMTQTDAKTFSLHNNSMNIISRVGLPSRPPAALQARCGNPVRLIVKEVLHPGHTWFLDLLAIWLPYIFIWLPTNCKWIHFTLRWEDRRILIDNSCKSRAPKEGYLP